MDDDIFRPVEGFPGYRISRDGEVQSRWLKAGRNSRLIETWRPLKPAVRACRHLKINLSRDGEKYNRLVHRLVLEAFIGPCPQGLVCCHNDGDPRNNRIENLRWDTPKANSDDALRHGTRAMGSQCNSKLTEEEVLEIRRLWAEGGQAKDLASRFSVSPRNIWAIVKGRSWKHVPLGPGQPSEAEGTLLSPEAGEEKAA